MKLALGDSARQGHGTLLLYWHATGSSPDEAAYSLGTSFQTVKDAGGVVAAPYSDPAAGQFEWFAVKGLPNQDDFLVADEIVGCLSQGIGIDPAHVHAMGMSAGALQTTALSFARSSYIASVATYSGGLPPGVSPTSMDPANRFAALVFEGGSADNVFGVDFDAASRRYLSVLRGAGHFAVLCNHGKGHSIPLDAAPSVLAFFAANGFGVWPSPYEAGLPATVPTYCAL